jgi:hypothetical protein
VIILKLTLVPFFLALLSLAGKRFGPSFAGWLAGLPVVVGPILFLLSIEQGADFAGRAAVFTLASVSTVIAFGVGYAWAARKYASKSGWMIASVCGLVLWFVVALIISRMSFSLTSAAILALASLLVAPFLYPAQPPINAASKLPATELLARMAAGVALTLIVTATAQTLGAAWSGIAALAPLLSPVLAIFTHRRSGGAHAIALFKGLVRGLYALATFCFVLASLIVDLGIPSAFAIAIAAALCVQGITFFMRPRSPRSTTTVEPKSVMSSTSD